MPEPWSKSLVRTSFSDWLVDNAVSEADGEIPSEVEAVLRSEIEAKAQVSGLKKALTSIKKLISRDTFESLEEELAEIREDFNWAKTKRGQYIAEVNDWVQGFHAEMRADPRFADLYVGGHESLEVVYVVGKADSQETLDAFLAFLMEKNPPRKLKVNVTISEN